jgi:hypothetical protein
MAELHHLAKVAVEENYHPVAEIIGLHLRITPFSLRWKFATPVGVAAIEQSEKTRVSTPDRAGKRRSGGGVFLLPPGRR